MNDTKALEIVNKIFIGVFDRKNIYSMDTLLEKYAFDIKLPKQVNDSTTNEVTWADSINSGRFITNENMDSICENDEVAVFIPQSFSIMVTGEVILVPKNKLKKIVLWISWIS